MIKARRGSIFNLTTTGSETGTRQALAQFCNWLALQDAGRDLCGTVELALAEALNNIAEHAYAGMSPGAVYIDAVLAQGSLTVRLQDNGHPLPDKNLPPCRLPDATGPIDALPEGGFGWYLIHNLTQQLSYRRDGDENHLELRFDVLPPTR